MRKLLICILLGFVFQLNGQQKVWDEALLTTPEKTRYQKTSTYAEVMAFIEALQQRSDQIHVEFMGTSMEGNGIPVAVLASSKVTSSEEAEALGKPIMYIQGNIHAGEVEGKEVVQQLMRDILLGDKQYLLDNQIILFAPIYNTDSNDKMEKGRRRSQEDSPVEVGIRSNSQGLDLNRDGIKMEAFETQGLIKNVLLKWDPEMLVDLHTTNGTWHGYGLTYAPSYHSAGEKGPYDFTVDKLFPEVVQQADANYGAKLGPYGYYFTRQGWPPKAIYTYNHHPRYIVNQMGLRNKVGILSEAFAHDRFYKRMNSTYAFVAEILEYTNTHGKTLAEINAKAAEDAVNNVLKNAGKVSKGVRFKMAALETPIKAYRTYDHTAYKDADGNTRYIRSGRIIEVPNVINMARFEATQNSKLPRGYYIPKSLKHIADHLKSQGVAVETLQKTRKVSGEVFRIIKYTKAERTFQGSNMATLEGSFVSEKETFRKGDYWVDMAQPLTNLIFYMLEPQSDDGLLTWNFFDDYLNEKEVGTKTVAYPIFKVYK
jgi:murein tripeptide amidase MpaA